MHIEDISWAVENLIDSCFVRAGEFESFNIGTGYEPISVLEVFNLVNAAHNGKFNLVQDEKRKRAANQERELLAINISKLKSVLPNYKPMEIKEWIEDIALEPGLRIGDSFIEDIYFKG